MTLISTTALTEAQMITILGPFKKMRTGEVCSIKARVLVPCGSGSEDHYVIPRQSMVTALPTREVLLTFDTAEFTIRILRTSALEYREKDVVLPPPLPRKTPQSRRGRKPAA